MVFYNNHYLFSIGYSYDKSPAYKGKTIFRNHFTTKLFDATLINNQFIIKQHQTSKEFENHSVTISASLKDAERNDVIAEDFEYIFDSNKPMDIIDFYSDFQNAYIENTLSRTYEDIDITFISVNEVHCRTSMKDIFDGNLIDHSPYNLFNDLYPETRMIQTVNYNTDGKTYKIPIKYSSPQTNFYDESTDFKIPLYKID